MQCFAVHSVNCQCLWPEADENGLILRKLNLNASYSFWTWDIHNADFVLSLISENTSAVLHESHELRKKKKKEVVDTLL